jgi:lambda repressor-like predicted transcriptional regulator
MRLPRKEVERRRALGAQRAEAAHIIVYEMKKRGHSMSSLARELGIGTNAVSVTIRGKNHSPRVLRGLVDIGVDPALLFDPRGATAQVQEESEGL